LNNKSFTVVGQYFVLAAGGLETPRIMLASNEQNSNGIGNEFDLVGRYYSPHANLTHGILILNSDVKIDKDTETLDGDVLYRKFISITDEFVLKGFMNCKVTLEPVSVVEKNELTDEFYSLMHPEFSLSESYQNLRGKKRFAFALNGAFDQIPNHESRIKLSDELDVLGTPMISLKHAITSDDIKAYRKFYHVLAVTVGSLGLGRFCFDQSLKQLFEQGGGASHHTGTTRMSDSASTGVVDKNCKVFGVDNLYISSASVFPTASHANPTYTIVALGIRLAHHLSKKIRKN
jgi:choline dehydrogenase-like flavoprotein